MRGVFTTCFLVFSTLPAIFNTFFYSIPVLFFIEFQARNQRFSLKNYCVPALNTTKVEGLGLICTYISIVFQRGACVPELCIPALNA